MGYDPQHTPRTRSTDEQGDTGLLYRFGEWVWAAELIMATVEVGRAVTEQAQDDLDPLLEPIDALRQGREGEAKGAMLVLVPAGTEAQHQSSPAQNVDGSGHPCQQRRMAKGYRAHQRSEPEPCRLRGGQRQGHPRFDR